MTKPVGIQRSRAKGSKQVSPNGQGDFHGIIYVGSKIVARVEHVEEEKNSADIR